MHRFVLRTTFAAAVLTLALAAAAPVPAAPPGGTFEVTPLVSDVPGAAAVTDPNLVNAWGLTRSPTSPWWVADNGALKSTLYNSAGTPNSLVVGVGGPTGGPTGAVFAGIDGNFLVATDTSTDLARASFIFDSEDGMIRAWRGGGTALVTASGDPGAVFKGLAIAQPTLGQPLLYAADFHNARVDVFNGAWQSVTLAGSFVDPTLPSGYAPFGIQTIGDRVFVSYAKQDADAKDEIAGQGRGFVDAYDLAGNLLARVAEQGQLNAPWGLARAPASFGRFAGDILVGNFGDGQINAYAETADGWEHRGTLRGTDGKKLVIDGLWALQFGNGGQNGTPDTLFFTAGPNDESHGLFGTITPG
ncbi:MAG: hypothetical protein QOD48_1723 [Gaiellaceae bacterium]|jgi:uncharacterized protein (TIGR03118 family)|nr:hypothetical protein [Gaiellaceae bacterium]